MTESWNELVAQVSIIPEVLVGDGVIEGVAVQSVLWHAGPEHC